MMSKAKAVSEENKTIDTPTLSEQIDVTDAPKEASQGDPEPKPEIEPKAILENEKEPELYTEQNAELEAMLNDQEPPEREVEALGGPSVKAAEVGTITQEVAAGMAVEAIVGVAQYSSKELNVQIKLSEFQLGVLSALFVPVIMKYGDAVKDYMQNMTEGVSKDSYIPEYIAAGGAAALGASIWWQNRKAKSAPRRQAVKTEQGDPESGD
jgi:hypothetical protein